MKTKKRFDPDDPKNQTLKNPLGVQRMSMAEDSPLEAPVGGFNRHAKLMDPATRDKVLEARRMDIDKFSEDRDLDPNVVYGIAEASMRLGRVPDLRQYGFAGDNAKAIKHFMAGEILQVAVEEIPAQPGLQETTASANIATAMRMGSAFPVNPSFGFSAFNTWEKTADERALLQQEPQIGCDPGIQRALTHDDLMSGNAHLEMTSGGTSTKPKGEKIGKLLKGLGKAPGNYRSPAEAEPGQWNQASHGTAPEAEFDISVKEQAEILAQLGLDEAQIRLVPMGSSRAKAVHKKTGKHIGMVWKEPGGSWRGAGESPGPGGRGHEDTGTYRNSKLVAKHLAGGFDEQEIAEREEKWHGREVYYPKGVMTQPGGHHDGPAALSISHSGHYTWDKHPKHGWSLLGPKKKPTSVKEQGAASDDMVEGSSGEGRHDRKNRALGKAFDRSVAADKGTSTPEGRSERGAAVAAMSANTKALHDRRRPRLGRIAGAQSHHTGWVTPPGQTGPRQESSARITAAVLREQAPTYSAKATLITETAAHFIDKAIKHKGALHKDTGTPAGEKIPADKVAAAAAKPGKEGKRARFAQLLATFKHKGK